MAGEYKSSDYVAMMREVRPRCPALEHVVVIGDSSWQRMHATPADVAALDAVAVTLSNRDPINIQYTSGTTGFPKGATLARRNIVNNGYAVGELLGYTERDGVCIPVPFYHCFGMVVANLAATTHGAAMVIPAPVSSRPPP